VRSNRLAGHTLPNEGRVFGYQLGCMVGSARCSCGEESPSLPSANARKKWHREHKDKIRAAEEGTNAG
jgi:hypothetical protein